MKEIGTGFGLGRSNKLEKERIEQLVKRADEASLKELFEHFYGKTFATIMSMVRNRHWAEDLTQETFIRAFRRLQSLREPAKFAPWLTSIATNVTRDAIKRERNYAMSTEALNNMGEVEGFLGIGESNTNAEGTSLVEEQILRNEDAARIQTGLYNLPLEQAQVVILFYYHDQKIEDIASLVGVSAGTVKSRLHRARQKLTELLQEEEPKEYLQSQLSKEIL